MIVCVKYCKSENEFHIPLLGGDIGVGLKKIFTSLVYNILPVVQIKDFKQFLFIKTYCKSFKTTQKHGN